MTSATRGPSPAAVASMFGVSVANVRDQYLRNAKQLEAMAAKAEATGKKARGYTADNLRNLAASAKAKANQ